MSLGYLIRHSSTTPLSLFCRCRKKSLEIKTRRSAVQVRLINAAMSWRESETGPLSRSFPSQGYVNLHLHTHTKYSPVGECLEFQPTDRRLYRIHPQVNDVLFEPQLSSSSSSGRLFTLHQECCTYYPPVFFFSKFTWFVCTGQTTGHSQTLVSRIIFPS